MSRAARSEDLLKKLEATLGLTEPGREFLIATLDPFHDTPINPCGFPDGSIDPQISQVVPSSVNITCPSGITTGTWDVIVINTPFTKPVKVFSQAFLGGTNTNPTNEVAIPSGASSITIGGVTALAVPTGAGFNPSTFTIDSSHTVTLLTPNDQYTSGDYRVTAKGFEVHNTTAMLNIQGLCTTFSTPMPSLDESGAYVSYLNTLGVASNFANASFLEIPMWPVSQAAAVLTRGSRQWVAEKGCYVTSRLNTSEVPVTDTGMAIQPFICSGNSSTATNLASLGTQSALVSTAVVVYPNVFWDRFDIHGAIFSGLSLSTTLTINSTIVVERHPDPTITDLVVLAKPPPERDDVALRLYTHISRALPTGVPVDQNGLGEWFSEALSSAADFIAPVLSVVPGPIGMIAHSVDMINQNYKAGKSVKSQVTDSFRQAAAQQRANYRNQQMQYETNPYMTPPLPPMSVPQANTMAALTGTRINARNALSTQRARERNAAAKVIRDAKALAKA